MVPIDARSLCLPSTSWDRYEIVRERAYINASSKFSKEVHSCHFGIETPMQRARESDINSSSEWAWLHYTAQSPTMSLLDLIWEIGLDCNAFPSLKLHPAAESSV